MELSSLFKHVDFVTTSLSPGFSVCRPRQYDFICWELNLISGFSAFFWLIGWADGINKYAWCLAGLSWCLIRLSHLYLEFYVHCVVIINDGGYVIVGGWLIYIRVWMGSKGWGLSDIFFCFTCAFVFCSLMPSVSLYKWLEHGSCCACFFVYYLFSLSLFPLTRSYWCICCAWPTALAEPVNSSVFISLKKKQPLDLC